MGQQKLNPTLMAASALSAFRDRANRVRSAGELRKSDTHRTYPRSGERERERNLRHEAEGLIPREQLGRLVDGRVVRI